MEPIKVENGEEDKDSGGRLHGGGEGRRREERWNRVKHRDCRGRMVEWEELNTGHRRNHVRIGIEQGGFGWRKEGELGRTNLKGIGLRVEGKGKKVRRKKVDGR